MGPPAFAGFFVLILGWPLNTYVTKRAFSIRKGLMSTRDKRMAVLTELIGAVRLPSHSLVRPPADPLQVKFIKFFAWEERWIQRAMDAREVEMRWMIKSRVNMVFFALIWIIAPILVSVIAFATFVLTGGELSVSIAFTVRVSPRRDSSMLMEERCDRLYTCST